jgi:hypothetical protein
MLINIQKSLFTGNIRLWQNHLPEHQLWRKSIKRENHTELGGTETFRPACVYAAGKVGRVQMWVLFVQEGEEGVVVA